MKQTPALDRAQERMQPGEITLHGFLGTDDRKLVDILVDDEETAHRLGVTHARIADALAAIQAQGTDLAEREVEVGKRYRVTVRDDRGVLPSPFGDGRFGKGDVELYDPQTDVRLHWNELTLHMIRTHGFYGGRGSAYRLDPEVVVRVLDLAPSEAGPDLEPPLPS